MIFQSSSDFAGYLITTGGPLRPTFKIKLGDGTVDCVHYIQFSELLLMLAVLTTRVFCRDNMTPILTDHGRKAFNCMMIDVVYMNLAIGRKALYVNMVGMGTHP
jgi:hypothetical protein